MTSSHELNQNQGHTFHQMGISQKPEWEQKGEAFRNGTQENKGLGGCDEIGGYSSRFIGKAGEKQRRTPPKLFNKTKTPNIGLEPEFNQLQGHALPAEEGVSRKPEWDHHGKASEGSRGKYGVVQWRLDRLRS
jgi:hypothetical protein